MAPKRVHVKSPDATNAVYVGRPGKWGNPFSHKPSRVAGTVMVDTLDEALDRWADWVDACPGALDRIRDELAGRDLACWCGPDTICHGDILLVLANG